VGRVPALQGHVIHAQFGIRRSIHLSGTDALARRRLRVETGADGRHDATPAGCGTAGRAPAARRRRGGLRSQCAGILRRPGRGAHSTGDSPRRGELFPLLRQESAAEHGELGGGARGAGTDPRRGRGRRRQYPALDRRTPEHGNHGHRRYGSRVVHQNLREPGQQVRLRSRHPAVGRSVPGHLQGDRRRHAGVP
jgi:hypothetical protein